MTTYYIVDVFFKLNDIKKNNVVNSVRYVPKSEQEIKPKTLKAGSLPRKQNKNISQNNKSSLKT